MKTPGPEPLARLAWQFKSSVQTKFDAGGKLPAPFHANESPHEVSRGRALVDIDHLLAFENVHVHGCIQIARGEADVNSENRNGAKIFSTRALVLDQGSTLTDRR